MYLRIQFSCWSLLGDILVKSRLATHEIPITPVLSLSGCSCNLPLPASPSAAPFLCLCQRLWKYKVIKMMEWQTGDLIHKTNLAFHFCSEMNVYNSLFWIIQQLLLSAFTHFFTHHQALYGFSTIHSNWAVLWSYIAGFTVVMLNVSYAVE